MHRYFSVYKERLWVGYGQLAACTAFRTRSERITPQSREVSGLNARLVLTNTNDNGKHQIVLFLRPNAALVVNIMRTDASHTLRHI